MGRSADDRLAKRSKPLVRRLGYPENLVPESVLRELREFFGVNSNEEALRRALDATKMTRD